MSGEAQFQKPGVVIKPEITKEKAAQLLFQLYGYRAVDIKELNSYDDRNYLVSVLSNENVLQFTLKITNSLESNIPGLIEAFNEIGQHISEKGLTVPVPILNKEGKYLCKIKLSENDDTINSVRLLKFIPGQMLKEVAYSERLLIETGQLLARLTNALQDYRNEALQKRSSIWNLKNAVKVEEFLFAISDECRIQMIRNVLKEFENKVLCKIDSLNQSIIHGDFNEQNILVRKVNEHYEPYAVIDFGDCHFAPQVFDLSMACAYVMLDCTTMDPLIAPAFVIQGYTQIRQITDEELALIPVCIKARLSQSLVMGAYSYFLDPNNEYTLSSSKTGWILLEKMTASNDSQLLQKWKTLCSVETKA
ncbi:hydroxylysine kinase-like isoform X2 [Leptotrombidium deliense]|uniref:Hydroxylysine kinase n=1 Tax=Leptotrombidium deliense TaxID=299467 RepID=A0A443SK05_9ACAR|nr:hydroxylysine kinase-like isoform X2 [Leptotrombidium deliense]